MARVVGRGAARSARGDHHDAGPARSPRPGVRARGVDSMKRRRGLVVILGLTLACAVVPTPASVVAVAADTTEPASDAVEVIPSEQDRALRAELRELATAWADGGGTF